MENLNENLAPEQLVVDDNDNPNVSTSNQPASAFASPQQSQFNQRTITEILSSDYLLNSPLQIGMPVAYIENRYTPTPARITKILSNDREGFSRVNLIIQKPVEITKWSHKQLTRTTKWQLKEEERLSVRITNPLMIYEKEGVEIPIHLRNNAQNMTDAWNFIGHYLSRLRLDSFPISHIGKFYVPVLWNYYIHCWLPERNVGSEVQPIMAPQEIKEYPKNRNDGFTNSFYQSFDEGFSVYFKQMYKNYGRWGKVEFRAVLKDSEKGVVEKLGV